MGGKMETTLIIRHFGEQNGAPQFAVVREQDTKMANPTVLTPPGGYGRGRPSQQ